METINVDGNEVRGDWIARHTGDGSGVFRAPKSGVFTPKVGMDVEPAPGLLPLRVEKVEEKKDGFWDLWITAAARTGLVP